MRDVRTPVNDGGGDHRDVRTADEAMRILRVAAQRAAHVNHTENLAAKGCADDDLRCAVDGARAVGVAWGPIGDVLGMARGNAYQRYRRRA